MPASTPNRGIPYPVPTDPINAYPTLAGSSATVIDTDIGNLIAADRARIASFGGIPVGVQNRFHAGVTDVAIAANGEGVVTFSTAFATAIAVVANVAGGIGGVPAIKLTGVAGFGFSFNAYDGGQLVTSRTVTISWVAIGQTTG